MHQFHPFTLRFCDAGQEKRYREATRRRNRLQARTAILVGILVFLLCGLLDIWFASPEAATINWQLRLVVIMFPVLVLLISSTTLFDRFAQPLLMVVCLQTGVGIIAIQSQVEIQHAAYYYPMLILLTFFTYNFIGLRFVNALVVDVLLLAAYNLYFGGLQAYPVSILVAHNIFLVSANLIGGTAGYLAERNRRIIHRRGEELQEERNFHFNRSIHDPLTGLPNRELLYDRLRQVMARSQRDGSHHCGLFIDLDGFKAINDRHGHEVGDQVLSAVAARLQAAVRETDTVARIGGDEFFVLAVDVDAATTSRVLAEKLLGVVQEPLGESISGMPLTASIGICMFPFDGMTIQNIIRRADDAMYEIKRQGKNDFGFAGNEASTVTTPVKAN